VNIQQLRDLAIKFIGLWCLTSAAFMLASIASMVDYFFDAGFHLARILHALLYFATLPVYFGFAYVLLFQTRAVAALLWQEEEFSTGPEFGTSLEVCVALIGLYNIPNVLYRIMSHLAFFVARPEGVSGHGYTDCLPDAVLLAVAVLCIVKSKVIAAYIRKYAE
jgi:hypothetical protein